MTACSMAGLGTAFKNSGLTLKRTIDINKDRKDSHKKKRKEKEEKQRRQKRKTEA